MIEGINQAILDFTETEETIIRLIPNIITINATL